MLKLQLCSPFYFALHREIPLNRKIPSICLNKHLTSTFMYLIDKWFYLNDNNATKSMVRYSSIYLSVHREDRHFLMNLYDSFDSQIMFDSKDNNADDSFYQIAGLNFDIKRELFENAIHSSLINLLVAILFSLIICFKWHGSSYDHSYYQKYFISIFFSFFLILTMTQSFIVYRLVFSIKLFPFAAI
jgi:hypothetical protein